MTHAISMKNVFFLTLGAVALGLPARTFAQSPSQYFDPGGKVASGAGLPKTTLLDYVFNIIKSGLGILAVVALALIIYAGFTILTSAGNEDKIKTGRQILLWAIIGLIIIFSSFSILLLFGQFI